MRSIIPPPSSCLFAVAIAVTTVSKLAAAQSGTVTIWSDPAFNTIRPCATRCIASVPGYIECPISPVYNSCFCRTDLTAIAKSKLWGCVDSWCNDGVSMDASAMTSIYTSYCNEINGAANNPGPNDDPADTSSPPRVAPSTEVKTTIETITTRVQSVVTRYTGTITTEVPSSVTKVIYETLTTVLDDKSIGQLADEYRKNEGGGGGLEKGYQVAIGVGVVAIVIIIVLLFLNKIRRRFFGYEGPYQNAPQPPMGGIQGYGTEQNLGNPQYYR